LQQTTRDPHTSAALMRLVAEHIEDAEQGAPKITKLRPDDHFDP